MPGLILAVLPLLAAISTEDIRRELPVTRGDQAIVRDAIERLVARADGPEETVMRNVVPITFRMGGRRCVLLRTRTAALGRSPVYCYELASDKLVEA